MTATIKQLADTCGVSKATVRRKLDELGYTGTSHIVKSGKTFRLSDQAASAVAAALSRQETPSKAESAPETVDSMYERYIASLEADKARLEAMVAEKDMEIAKLNAAILDLANKLAEKKKPSIWSRLLPSRAD